MRDVFMFDGVSSLEFNAYVFDQGTHMGGAPDYANVVIPARHGELLLNNYRLNNVTHRYYIVIPNSFEENFSALRAFLLSRDGYCRLEDTFHPTEFYQAAFLSALEPVIARDKALGKVLLEFQRKPQRWLKTGEERRTVITALYTSGTILNPTLFNCNPVFILNSANLNAGFSIRFGGNVIEMDTYTGDDASNLNSNDFYIDTETMMAWVYVSGERVYYTHLLNFTVSMHDRAQLQLVPGDNTIQLSSTMANLDIIPRWYTA